MYFIYFVFTCLFLTVTTSIVICKMRVNAHKSKRKKYEEIINENMKSKELKDFFLILCERAFDYIRIYFIFQGVAMVTNGLSLLFTISSLILTASDSFTKEAKGLTSKGWGVLISVISIIFVCINIYINPTKRAGQYLEQWRNTDKNIVKLMARLQNDKDNTNNQELKEYALECAEELSNGEYRITSDEE